MSEPDDARLHPPDKRPHNPNSVGDQVVSALYLAGEALASDKDEEAIAYATPDGDESEPPIKDYGWLRDVASHIRQVVAEDPRRADLLRRLPEELGDGENLQILFGNLFPEQRSRRKQAISTEGKSWLTPTQIEVLRETAQGKTALQIAAQRNCTPANVHKILHSIEQRLHTHSPQESVALAISMGCLPLDVMEFVKETAHCAVRDYSPMNWQMSAHGLEPLEDRAGWQELGAFGLMLMLATNTVSMPLHFAAHSPPTNGVLYRLEPQTGGTFRMQQIVGPGRLRNPHGLAIAPPAASRQGFTPGHVYVVHSRATQSGLNQDEIVEFSPDGEEQRVFCGGRSRAAGLMCGRGMAFDASGALLATTGGALLRFTEGGGRVHPLLPHCFMDVAVAPRGLLYMAYYSSRGGCIMVYGANGKQRQQFAQLPLSTSFYGLKLLPGGEIAALRCSGQERMMQIYDKQGEMLRCWRVPDSDYGAFAFNATDNRFYISCCETGDIAVYAPDGKLQHRIALDRNIAPRTMTFDRGGTLWCIGSLITT